MGMGDTEDTPKVELVGEDERNLTFVIRDEDHTLGNSLRYVLARNPDVKFCGYSIPHPSENILKIRIETFHQPAITVFKKGLKDLRAIANHLKATFEAEVDAFTASQGNQ